MNTRYSDTDAVGFRLPVLVLVYALYVIRIPSYLVLGVLEYSGVWSSSTDSV